jgi:hypothetical protein
MKNNLAKFPAAGAWIFAAMSLEAQNYTKSNQRIFTENDLNAAVGLSDAWIWLQNSIVPLAMLTVFFGVIIVVAELHYRQSKIMSETLRLMAEMNRQSLKSAHE